jgi:apolipoprotein D and lipocalin family protein
LIKEVTSVPALDLRKYLGKWYEICRLPLKWEDETATDITANYSLNENGNVRVDNRCFNKDGKPSQAIGEAKPVDGSKSRLKVTFLPKFLRWIPFTSGDYWVLKIDPDYTMALVGTPDHKYLWILSREPTPPQDMVDAYMAEARDQGFQLTDLITPHHTGGEVTDQMLRSRA